MLHVLLSKPCFPDKYITSLNIANWYTFLLLIAEMALYNFFKAYCWIYEGECMTMFNLHCTLFSYCANAYQLMSLLIECELCAGYYYKMTRNLIMVDDDGDAAEHHEIWVEGGTWSCSMFLAPHLLIVQIHTNLLWMYPVYSFSLLFPFFLYIYLCVA